MLVRKLLEPKLGSQPKRPLLQQVQTPTTPFVCPQTLGALYVKGASIQSC